MSFVPSSYQRAISEWVEHGEGNGIIQAVAGSGKTTTIEYNVHRLPRSLSKVYLVFNRHNKDEAKAKGLPAITLNGLGYRACLRQFKTSGSPNGGKIRDIIRPLFDPREKKFYGKQVDKLVRLAMAHGMAPIDVPGIHPLTHDTQENWLTVFDQYDVQLDNDDATIDECIHLARSVLRRSVLDTYNLSFDDQVYMPVVYNIPMDQYDFVMVDEAQDLNMVQRALIKKALRPGGRLLAVGDRQQAIYGWRGADAHSMDNIKDEFDCVEMPLSICYRCATNIVKEAQQFSDQIEPSPTAIEGEVIEIERYGSKTFTQEDMVICRNNAPLVTLAYRLLSARVAFRMLGRDFGSGLVSILERMKSKLIRPNREDFDEIIWLSESLKEWASKEIQRALARDEDDKAQRVEDTVGSLIAIIEGSGAATIDDVIREVQTLFSDDDENKHRQPRQVLTLSSVHRAKGREADRVFILDRHLMPSPYARTTDAKQQEINIQYVAVTRAKKTLAYIYGEGWWS